MKQAGIREKFLHLIAVLPVRQTTFVEFFVFIKENILMKTVILA